MSTATTKVRIDQPLIICGVGRSGTSLLQAMLAAHPDVVFPMETHFFRRYVAQPRVRREHEQAGLAALLATLSADTDLARCEFTAQDLLRGERNGNLDLQRIYRRLLTLSGERSHGTRIGDKDPKNLEHLPALHAVFPDAFVLHVVRDPRDVVLSRTKADWSAHRPWWLHALIVREQLRHGRAQGPALFGSRYIEVRYEDLVADPESVLRDLATRVGLEWSPNMLEFGAAAKRLVDASEMQWKSAILGPLLTGNTGKWRRELTPFQIRWTEAACRESFDTREYDLALPEGLAAFQRVAIGTIPAVRTAASLAYELSRMLGSKSHA